MDAIRVELCAVPDTAGVLFEVSAIANGDCRWSYLTVGMCLCGVLLVDDVWSVDDSSVDDKEWVEYSTSADSGCNDSGWARVFGMAEAAEPT